MIRATTPVHTFYFTFDPAELLDHILISYAQWGEVFLEKTEQDLAFSQKETADGTVYAASLRLTQEETKLFTVHRGDVQLQVRALSKTGEALASRVFNVPLADVLNDEVLV